VGKLWAAGMLSITYPHGSARIGPQDASIKSTGHPYNSFHSFSRQKYCLPVHVSFVQISH
jgi:hypothetical protein